MSSRFSIVCPICYSLIRVSVSIFCLNATADKDTKTTATITEMKAILLNSGTAGLVVGLEEAEAVGLDVLSDEAELAEDEIIETLLLFEFDTNTSFLTES